MKTKLLLAAALIGAVSLSAHAGVFVGISLPVPRVVVPVPRVVVTAPAPFVAAPVVETIPACPAPGYVWAPGYWSGYGPARIWVAGCWRPGPAQVVYSYPYDRRDNDRRDNDRRDNGRRDDDRHDYDRHDYDGHRH